jgi:hypothetical protein
MELSMNSESWDFYKFIIYMTMFSGSGESYARIKLLDVQNGDTIRGQLLENDLFVSSLCTKVSLTDSTFGLRDS